jgi:hypothetical protein
VAGPFVPAISHAVPVMAPVSILVPQELVTGIGTPRVKQSIADLASLSPALDVAHRNIAVSGSSSRLMRITVSIPVTALRTGFVGSLLVNPGVQFQTQSDARRGSGASVIVSPPVQQFVPIASTAQHILVDSGMAEDTDAAAEQPSTPVIPAAAPNLPKVNGGQATPPRATRVHSQTVSTATERIFADEVVVLYAPSLGANAIVETDLEPAAGSGPVVLAGTLALLAVSRETGRRRTPAIQI